MQETSLLDSTEKLLMSAFRVPYLQPFAFALPAETTGAVRLANFIKHCLVKTLKTEKKSLVNSVSAVHITQCVFSNGILLPCCQASDTCKALCEEGVVSIISILP